MRIVKSKQRMLDTCEAVLRNYSKLYYIRKRYKNLHFHILLICICRENLQKRTIAILFLLLVEFIQWIQLSDVSTKKICESKNMISYAEIVNEERRCLNDKT